MTLQPLFGGFALTLTAADLSPLGLTPSRLTEGRAVRLLRALGVRLRPGMELELYVGGGETLVFVRSGQTPPSRPLLRRPLRRGRARRKMT